MVTEMITLKLEESFLREVDEMVSRTSYHSRTEFIRQAMREKLEEYRDYFFTGLDGNASQRVKEVMDGILG